MIFKVLEDLRKEKGEKADQNDKRNKTGEDTPQDVITEQKGQNDPKKAAPEEVKTQHDRPDFQSCPHPRTYAEWKVGGFLVPILIFCAFHNLSTFFYAVAEPVWMVSWFGSNKKEGLSPRKIFAGNTLARRERGRFSAKPPGGSILRGREARKYLRS